MSRYIATRAIRGAHRVVDEFAGELEQALTAYGAEAPIAFPNTAYYLPFILGMTTSMTTSRTTSRFSSNSRTASSPSHASMTR